MSDANDKIAALEMLVGKLQGDKAAKVVKK